MRKIWIFLIIVCAVGASVGGSLYFSSMMNNDISKKAKSYPLVMGELLSVQQTNVYFSNQPQCKLTVQFTTADGKQITASDKKVIPLTALAQTQPGMLLPVRYNPKNPQDIAIDFLADSAAIQQAMSHHITDGILAIGVIQSAKRTGANVGGDGVQLELTINFYTQEGKEIITTDKEVYASADLPTCQPGYWMPLRYDPKNPKIIALDYDADPKLVEKARYQRYLASGEMTKEEVNLRETGVETKGVILSSAPTGNIINGDESEFKMEIKITKQDGSPYTFNYITGVAQKDLKYAVAGALVYVYYFPKDKKDLLVEWDND